MTIRSFVSSLAVLATSLSAFAEGYQVNTLSAKQMGMAHSGAALKLGAESQYFNPAGMGFLDKTLDLSASVDGVMATASATVDGVKYKTDNKVSTPMLIDAAFSIYDNFKAGVAFYAPYGSSINWTDNWPGAVLSQKVDLKVFTIQPTLAWRPIPNLSVGAGLMLSWGSVDLSKGLVTAATADRVLAALGVPSRFGDTTPASVNLKGTADVAFGVNVGAMYDITPSLTVGASFRSQMTMKVKAGDARVNYANDLAKTVLASLNVLNEANFKAEMPAPWVLSFGAAYKPIDKLTLAFDARLTGWNAYKSLDIEFLSDQLKPYNQHLEKNYRNAWAFSLGAQYAVTSRCDLRAGVMLDTTPVNSEYYNPETPGMTKIEPTIGLSFRPVSRLSVDVALMYVAGLGEKGATNTYPDLLAASMPALGLPATSVFTADYGVHAWIPAIGVSYSF